VQEQIAATGSALAVGTGLAVATGGSPIATGVGAALVGVVGFVLKEGLSWKSREIDRWWEAVRGTDGPAFEAAVGARSGDADVQDTVMRSVRTLLDAFDPASTPPLARLSRWYLSEKRRPDAFFRGATRLLAEATAPSLRALAEAVVFANQHLEHDRGTLQVYEGPNGEPAELRLELHLDRNTRQQILETVPCSSTQETDRAFELLDQSGLGRRVDRYGSPAAEIRREAIVGLLRILQP